MASSANAGSASIQVAVRLRPMNECEKKHGTLPVVTASTTDKTVTVIKGQGSRQVRSQFNFDQVFTSFSTQEEVFEQTLKPVIGDVLKGYESTVFAYGQTGTGKTHTMEGDLSDPETHGVIPRSAQTIFETLRKPQYSDHSITCSYLEIYNEELCDLLADEVNNSNEKRPGREATKLEIMVGKKGTFCRGLSEISVNSAEDVLELMHRAQQQRRVGETKMNKASSRSHSIFTMNVKAKALLVSEGTTSTMEFNGKLHMVDLAGSECAKTAGLDKASGVEAARERERMNINRSLLTLGRVISMLKEQSESKKVGNVRIPYRDSKLTRILQESLGGRCKTVIIATLSPSVTAIEESISTLNYAQSANGIVNKPVSTSFMSIGPAAPSSNPAIGNDLSGDQGSTVEHWHQMECRLQYMQAQVEEAQAALARKHMQQQELVERADRAEEQSRELEKKNYEATRKLNEMQAELVTETSKRNIAERDLKETQIALKKTSAILCATQKTEASLISEAKTLLRTLKESISEGEKLYRIITQEHGVETKKRLAARNFHAAALSVIQDKVTVLETLSSECENFVGILKNAASEAYDQDRACLSSTENLIEEVTENVEKVTEVLKKLITDDDGIVPLLGSTLSSVKSSVTHLVNDVCSSEETLVTSCSANREQLQEQRRQLELLGKNQNSVLVETLSMLENNMAATKKVMDQIVNRATDALRIAKKERAERMKDHNAILGRWRASSASAVSRVEETAKQRIESLSKSIGEFAQETCHHDIVDKALADQRLFLREKGSLHLDSIGTQHSALLEQAEILAVASRRQEELRKEVVKNIMSGVKDLVHKQISEVLAKEEKKHMALLASHNRDVADQTMAIQDTAKEINETIEKSNLSLQKQAQIVRKNDDKARRVMEDTNDTLGNIVLASKDHQESILSRALEAGESVTRIETLDTEAIKTLEIIKGDGEECESRLKDVVHAKTESDIQRLAAAGHGIQTYSTLTIIPEAVAALDSVEHSRKGFIENVHNIATDIGQSLLQGCGKVENVAQKQHETLSCLRSETDLKGDEFKHSIAAGHYEQISTRKQFMHDHVQGYHFKTQGFLSDSTTKASHLKGQIDDFSSNVMHAEEEVDPLPQRNVLAYSETFSSTPSAEVIIRDIDLGIVDNISAVIRDKRIMPHEDVVSNISRSSDTTSIKSTCSVTTVASSPVSKDENSDPQLVVNTSMSSSRKAMSTGKVRRPLSRSRAGGTPVNGTMRKKPRNSGTPQRSMNRMRSNTDG